MFHAPRDIYGPNLMRTFVHQLGGTKSVAKFLQVTERTVSRWLETGKVPRAAVLALFWETQYGRSQIFTEQVNEIRLLYRRVCLLQDQYARAKDIVAGLRQLHAGTANEAFFDDMTTFKDLPPDNYGAMTPMPMALDTRGMAEREQAQVVPAQSSTRGLSSGAKAAFSSLERVRKARAA